VSSSRPAPAAARLAYPAARRLRDSASFALFTASGREAATGRWWRAGRRWVSAAALINPRAPALVEASVEIAGAAPASAASRPPSRFGVTVGKRNAARSIDRSLIKRILREAARHAAPALDRAAAVLDVQLDVVLRLKAPVPKPAALARTQLKRELRAEADALLARLTESLAKSVPPSPALSSMPPAAGAVSATESRS
jgi:RNase P protein component